jgi:hypothetical protein
MASHRVASTDRSENRTGQDRTAKKRILDAVECDIDIHYCRRNLVFVPTIHLHIHKHDHQPSMDGKEQLQAEYSLCVRYILPKP